MVSFDLVVTRHNGLIEWLIREGHINEETPRLSHVTADVVTGKRVVGVLPLNLASVATSVSEVAMPSLRQDQRGMDLTPEEMDKAGANLVTYVVRKID